MIPLWLKMSYTLLAAVIVAVYVVRYPPGNFLWFSDIALVLTVPALWLESGLLASIVAVGVLLPEAFWNLAYFLRLASGKRLSGLTDYMFDRSKPRYLRALSLFHVALPVLLVWMVSRLGYTGEALAAMTVISWVVLILTYRFVDPRLNVNWVHGHGRQRVSPPVRLGLLMLAYPILVYYPTHLLLLRAFG